MHLTETKQSQPRLETRKGGQAKNVGSNCFDCLLFPLTPSTNSMLCFWMLTQSSQLINFLTCSNPRGGSFGSGGLKLSQLGLLDPDKMVGLDQLPLTLYFFAFSILQHLKCFALSNLFTLLFLHFNLSTFSLSTFFTLIHHLFDFLKENQLPPTEKSKEQDVNA